MRLRQCALIGDGGVEGGEIDHLDRLGAENERIIAHAFRIDFRRDGGGANIVQAFFGSRVDAAVEQMRGDDVDRIFQAAPQRQDAAFAVIGVARRPIILRGVAAEFAADDVAAIGAADRRKRDRLVEDQRVRLQAALQCRQIGHRFHRRAGLTLGLRGAVELAQRIRKAPGHGEDAAGLVFQHQCRAFYRRPHAQLRLRAGGVWLLLRFAPGATYFGSSR